MADVITTIKEYEWIIKYILPILAAFFGGGWAGKGITWTFALSRRRKLARLQKRRARLIQLHESDREYYGWLMSTILYVLFIFGASMILHASTSPPEFKFNLNELFDFGIGLLVMRIIGACLGTYKSLQTFDRLPGRIGEILGGSAFSASS